MTAVTMPPDTTPSIDPYLLRGLLWCQACGVPMVPARAGDTPSWNAATLTLPLIGRAYRCPLGVLHEVGAEPVEEVVWTAAERRANISTFAFAYRKPVLDKLRSRVLLDGDGEHVSFAWRN